jgi:hypothetical protein
MTIEGIQHLKLVQESMASAIWFHEQTLKLYYNSQLGNVLLRKYHEDKLTLAKEMHDRAIIEIDRIKAQFRS